MSNIDKQWLKQKIADMEAARDEIPFGLDEDDSNTLAALRIALASLEAEAVAYVDPQAFHNFSVYRAGETDNKRMGREWMWANPDAGLIPVYTAPPAPVAVPDDVSGPLAHAYKELTPTFMRNHIDVFERYGIYPDGSAGIQAMRIALDGMNSRAAMLQGAKNAESRCSIQTAPALDSSPKIAESRCSNSPVIPDGWVACSEQMPESNKYVLVCNGVWVGMGLYNDGEQFEDCERWQDEHGEFIDLLHHPVSHWMQLPEAPQKEGE